MKRFKQGPVIELDAGLQIQNKLKEAISQILPAGSSADVGRLKTRLDQLASQFGREAYAAFLRQNFNIELNSELAKTHWDRMVIHHQNLRKRSGLLVDFRVSFFDYLLRKARLLRSPTVVEKDQYQELRRDTIVDAKTGLFNFRHLHVSLEREIDRAQRYGQPCSLIFLDVDHFKNINDEHGHLTGDAVLVKVSEIIMRSVRSCDLPCRYGGEEFAIIAPQTTKEGAKLVAERIRQRIAQAKILDGHGKGIELRVSGGVACFPEDALSGMELLEQGDRALYQAKSQGRNCIVVSGGGESDQRRRPRQNMQLPAVISTVPEQRALSATKNISECGVLLEVSDPLQVGSVLRIEFALGLHKAPVHCVGTVTRVKPSGKPNLYEVGVSIVNMSRDDHMRYVAFIQTQLIG